MNGTLFSDEYRYTNNDIFLTEAWCADEFTWVRIPDYGWATTVAKTQLRAAGIAGSLFIDLYYTRNQSGLQNTIIGGAKENIILPAGYFGSNNPPLIFVMPQYGTNTYYRQIDDTNGSMGEIPYGQQGQPPSRPKFRTYIEGLEYSDNRWRFTAVHEIVLPSSVLNNGKLVYTWAKQYKGMVAMDWPTVEMFPVSYTFTRILLHWYAMGVDPNL
jgi:hypothetical protein